MSESAGMDVKKAFQNTPWRLYSNGSAYLAVSALFTCCFPDMPFSLKCTLLLCYMGIYLLFVLFCLGTVSAIHPQSSYMKTDKQPSRLIIYATDVQKIHSCSDSTATRKMQQVRAALGKQPHHVVTIMEYCDYWGLDYFTTCTFLNLI